MSPPNLMELLWPRKGLILLSGLLFAALGYGVSTVLPVRYVGEGLLVMAPAQDPAAAATDRVTNQDMLRSRTMLSAVIDQLGLTDQAGLIPAIRLPSETQAVLARKPAEDLPPDEAQAQRTETVLTYLQRHIRIVGEENSRALTVSFDAGTPELAASVVNALMQAYIAADLQTKRDTALRSSGWLAERAELAKHDADAADQRVQGFQSDHGLVSLQSGSLTALDLSNQQAQLASARQDAIQAQSAFDSAQAGAGQVLAASPAMQALQQRETEVRQQLGAVGSLGALNPRRVALEGELRAVQAQVAAEAGRTGNRLAKAVTAAKDRVTKLEAAIASAQVNARGSSADQLELDRLERDAQTKRLAYNTLFTRVVDAQYEASQVATARVASPAVPPLLPAPSRTAINMVLGLLTGMVMATGLLLLRQLTRTRIGSAAELVQVTGIPTVGTLPATRLGRPSLPERAVRQPQSALSETLRGVRLAVQQFSPGGGGTTILVSSAERGEGKSSVAVALARRTAGDGMRVLLIEADLHRPRLRRLLGMAAAPTLETLLAGKGDFSDAVQVDARSGLHCLLAAGTHPNPITLLTGGRFAALIERARSHYDMVVIDSPPLLRVSDPVLLSEWADHIMLVVRAGRTPQALVLEAMHRFPANRQSRLLTLLTHARAGGAVPQGFYAGYGTQRGWADDAAPPERADAAPARRGLI